MATLLYHETTTHGMVATPDHVRGVPLPSRKYHHEGHFLMVDGPEADVEDILKIAGYRLATAAEQNAYHKQHEAAGKLEESEQDQGEEETQPEPVSESKPARSSRKKG